MFQGRENRGFHRQGSELAAMAVLCFALASYVLYVRYTGWLAGLILGEYRKQQLACGEQGDVRKRQHATANVLAEHKLWQMCGVSSSE